MPPAGAPAPHAAAAAESGAKKSRDQTLAELREENAWKNGLVLFWMPQQLRQAYNAHLPLHAQTDWTHSSLHQMQTDHTGNVRHADGTDCRHLRWEPAKREEMSRWS